MKILSRLTVVGMAGALVAACSGIDLNMTKKMDQKGDAFQRALFTEYVELARMEDEEVDTQDAVYFDNRAKAAAMGKDTGPQALADRALPASAVPDLRVSRNMLTNALDKGAGKAAPADAARAQAMFDCWMQEQEENDQPKDIAACKHAFKEAMKKVFVALDKKPKPKKKAAKKAPAPQDFIVYFGFNSSTLDGDAIGTVYDVMAASDGGRRTVVLTGHTDTSGDKAYNRALSKKRVEAVKQGLLEIGIEPGNIMTEYFGEDIPAMKTGDGVKNAKNRRVNVTVK